MPYILYYEHILIDKVMFMDLLEGICHRRTGVRELRILMMWKIWLIMVF